MRVTTIDGGFRGRPASGLASSSRAGLGALSTSIQNDEADRFNAQFDRFDRVLSLLRSSEASGAIPIAQAVAFEAQFTVLSGERNAHLAQLPTLNTQAELMEWRSTGDSIAQRALALADSAGAELGYSEGIRPWQIGVTLIGGAIVFGGAAYLLSRMGKSGKKRRRR